MLLLHGKIEAVATHKLTSTNAFIIFDLEDAETASGLVRCAPKILPSSAKELARSATYTFAAHGCKRGGASAGINAKGSERDEAVRAFTEEIAEMVAAGKFLPDAGRGVTEEDLQPLRASDRRGDAHFSKHGFTEDTSSKYASSKYNSTTLATYLQGVSAVAATEAALGALEGRTVALEGFGPAGLAAAKELEERGAKVVAVATAAGMSKVAAGMSQAGFSHAELAEAFAAYGQEMVEHLETGSMKKHSEAEQGSETEQGREAGQGREANSIWSVEADIFFTGSKIGAVDHNVAELFSPMALVSLTPLAFTTKALVALQQKGTKVLPDFVCLGGSIYAEGEIPSADKAIATARTNTAALVEEAEGHPEGIFLGVCAIAEQFLLTWRDELPFGRPLAP